MKRDELNPDKPQVAGSRKRSHEPDEALDWCAKCQAHTTSGKRTVETASGGSREVACCRRCKSYMWRWVPDEIGKAINSCRQGAMVLGSIMLACVVWAGWTRSESGFYIALALAPFFLLAIGIYIWFVYWQSLWRSWVKLQGQQSPSKHD